MPTRNIYVPPEIRLFANGPDGVVVVFATYNDEDVDQGSCTHFFTTSPYEDGCFDVRQLPNYTEVEHPPYLTGENDTEENRKAWDEFNENQVERKHIDTILLGAIQSGKIPPVPIEEVYSCRYGNWGQDDWEIFAEDGYPRILAMMNLTLDRVITTALLDRINESTEPKVLADTAYHDMVDFLNTIDDYGASDTEPRSFAWRNINDQLGIAI